MIKRERERERERGWFIYTKKVSNLLMGWWYLNYSACFVVKNMREFILECVMKYCCYEFKQNIRYRMKLLVVYMILSGLYLEIDVPRNSNMMELIWSPPLSVGWRRSRWKEVVEPPGLSLSLSLSLSLPLSLSLSLSLPLALSLSPFLSHSLSTHLLSTFTSKDRQREWVSECERERDSIK